MTRRSNVPTAVPARSPAVRSSPPATRPSARAVARTAVAAAAGLALVGAARQHGNTTASLQSSPPARVAPADSAAGAYLTVVTGCNDCHTSTWAATNGHTPVAEQLTGSAVGYRGPWGTTYAANLRLLASRVGEEGWVSLTRTARGGTGRPPMPWANTRQMCGRDLRLMYRYLRRLGPAGRAAPAFVPPGAEPAAPYLEMVPRPPAHRSAVVRLTLRRRPACGAVEWLPHARERRTRMTVPVRMSTPGVHHLALRVSDLARARRFYTETLGFPVLLEAPNFLLVAAGGTPIALRGPEAETPAGDRFTPFRVGLDHVALVCTDEAELGRVAAALAAAGVENTGAKLDDLAGKRYVAFKDPDRIAWEFYMV